MLFFRSILVLFLLFGIAIEADTLSIQVKQTLLRAKPSFLGKQIIKLHYAQQVEARSLKSGWYFVQTLDRGIRGWVHSSAISAKPIVLSASGRVSTTDVSQSEVLMAGKGFNKQVEDEYKRGNRALNFSMVDKIESSKEISQKSLNSFVNYGKLKI